MKPGDIVAYNWQWTFILGSYLAAVIGSFVALQCARQIPQGRGNVNWTAVWASAIALGGGGIWYMHFLGMAAFQTPRSLGMRYDLALTMGSMVAAIVVAALALWFVGRNPKAIFNLLIGGFLAGCGVAVMHYAGMGAMRMQAVYQWNMSVVALSVLIAIVAATAALWLTFNTQHRWQRIGAAFVMGVAVCGMHYTGMYAGSLVCVAEQMPNTGPVIGDLQLPYFVVLVGSILLGVVSIFSLLASNERTLPPPKAAPAIGRF